MTTRMRQKQEGKRFTVPGKYYCGISNDNTNATEAGRCSGYMHERLFVTTDETGVPKASACHYERRLIDLGSSGIEDDFLQRQIKCWEFQLCLSNTLYV